MTYAKALQEAKDTCKECLTVNDCVEEECRWHWIIKALEKQIPKEPIEDYYMDIDPITGEPYPVGIVSLCPNCKTWLDIEDGCGEKSKHCKECGQAISWEGEE